MLADAAPANEWGLISSGQIPLLKWMINYQALDRLFAAIADPARRAMVERLAQGPASVSELARPLDMSLPAVMQHLAVLEESGLVTSEKLGRARICRIDPLVLEAAADWIAERRKLLERSLRELPAGNENGSAQKS